MLKKPLPQRLFICDRVKPIDEQYNKRHLLLQHPNVSGHKLVIVFHYVDSTFIRASSHQNAAPYVVNTFEEPTPLFPKIICELINIFHLYFMFQETY